LSPLSDPPPSETYTNFRTFFSKKYTFSYGCRLFLSSCPHRQPVRDLTPNNQSKKNVEISTFFHIHLKGPSLTVLPRADNLFATRRKNGNFYTFLIFFLQKSYNSLIIPSLGPGSRTCRSALVSRTCRSEPARTYQTNVAFPASPPSIRRFWPVIDLLTTATK
jgi:hypothetical protein